jgi:hypothetical protein
MNQPHCQRCGAAMIWAKLPGRGWVALDAEPREPRVALIAYNPRTNGGHELSESDMPDAWRWAYADVTFHPVHADVCRRSPEGPRRPGQTTLAL